MAKVYHVAPVVSLDTLYGLADRNIYLVAGTRRIIERPPEMPAMVTQYVLMTGEIMDKMILANQEAADIDMGNSRRAHYYQ